ncbi:TraC family protein [Brucella intermedia]|uniref:Conjugal transfer protein Dtr system n=1 Tax=Brucella intermedia M86 TaxID=1234597 RepID=M5K2X6_9HYPH|nr:TraC family protein [Brucella intermedia]ELT51214.1 conjugal transfer protein Dtr system [Brucella intermedia M86]
MAKRSKTPAQIKAEIDRLNGELAQAEAREGERIGSIAVKAGLHEIEVSDTDLLQAFRDVAARFRPATRLPKPAS